MWTKLKLVLGDIWDFIKPTVTALLTNIGKVVQQSATNAVIAAAADYKEGKSSSEIKDHAISIMTDDLKTKGIQVGVDVAMSFVNTVIELALQKAKSDGTVVK
jgi:hypothetical protein